MKYIFEYLKSHGSLHSSANFEREYIFSIVINSIGQMLSWKSLLILNDPVLSITVQVFFSDSFNPIVSRDNFFTVQTQKDWQKPNKKDVANVEKVGPVFAM